MSTVPTPPAPHLHLPWVDATRSIAALAIIALHVAASAVTDPDLLGSTGWWISNWFNAATRWGVPVFVMLSGALLLRPDPVGESWLAFYRRRAARILLPLLAWSLFYLGYELYGMASQGEALNWRYLLKQTSLGLPYYHLWFLFMIPGLYLLTPLLRRMLAVLERRQVVMLTAAALLLAMFDKLFAQAMHSPPPFAGVLFVPFIGYFLAGYLLAGTAWPVRSASLVFLGSIVLTALGCGGLAERDQLELGTYFYDRFSLTVIPMGVAAFALCRHLPQNRWLDKLAPLSLGIYLIHPLVLDLLWQQDIRPSSGDPLWTIPLLTLFTYAVSAAGSWLLLQLPGLRKLV